MRLTPEEEARIRSTIELDEVNEYRRREAKLQRLLKMARKRGRI